MYVYFHYWGMGSSIRGVSWRSPSGGQVSHYFWRPGAKLKNVALTSPPPRPAIWPPEVFFLNPLLVFEWQERVQELEKEGGAQI